MQYMSIIPALRVGSIAKALPVWTALGFAPAFAFAGDELLAPGELERATFARLDGPSKNPVSVFLDTERARAGATVHLILAHPREVDEAASRLQESGLRPTQPPVDQPWGMRDLRVSDDDGNVMVVGAATQP